MSDHMGQAVRAARETPIAHEHDACITECIMCPSCTAAMLRAALPHLLEAVIEEDASWECHPYVFLADLRDAARRIAEGT